MNLKTMHLSEAFANSFGSYPIGYGISLLVLPTFAPLIQKDPFTVNLVITLIFATVSFARVYFLRSIFERYGINDNLFKLLPAMVKHLREIGRNKR
ncbi:MAG: hypothetical protein ABI340_02700 [Nitrososphaera sp.]|jgi:hypothetical protein